MMGVLDFFLGLLPSWARLAVYALRCVHTPSRARGTVVHVTYYYVT